MTSVASRNLFDLLDDEVEDFDVPNEGKQETTETPVVQKKVDRSRASRTEARIRHEYPMRGGFKNVASNKSEETRTAPRDRNVGPRLSGRREESGGGGGGGTGGDFPPRNSRGARTGERARGTREVRRGREFDRHSASGKYDSEKKETQGWGNWQNNNEGGGGGGGGGEASWENNETKKGTPKDDWASGEAETTNAPSGWNDSNAEPGWNSTEQPSETKWEENAQDEGQVNAGTTNWIEESAAPKAEWDGNLQEVEDSATQSAPPVSEEAIKTLDEYLAEKAQKSLELSSLPEVRKANEGVDDSQWKDAVPLQKEEEEDFLFTGKEQSIKLKSKRSSKVSKNVLEIDQTFGERPGGGYQRNRARGRRGGRGRDGGTDRDNFRERRDYDRRDSRDHENRRGASGRGVVNLDDATAFPTLGSV